MAKSLIIVESPAKAATIKRYLDGSFEVEASAGHIKDLPERALGVDVAKGFSPRFEVVRGKRKIVDRLKNAASGAAQVYLAPDPDREGEAIAWHIFEEIESVAPNVSRVMFHEITRDAVRRALGDPRPLDRKMYESQLARRILDRLVGYQISPLLWRKVQGGLSAGRVQSVAVRLVVEREREIEAFVPVEYWIMTASLERASETRAFKATLKKIGGKKAEVHDRETADALIARLRGAEWLVRSVERKERRRPAGPPYITSTLQQDASRLLHFSPSHTMAVAQRLYEGVEIGDEGRVGLITYMRTDSVRVSNEALGAARETIGERFGPAYVPEKANLYRNKRSAQDAHEAIRPTYVARAPADLKGQLGRDEYRLYNLIYSRFLACQMTPAVYDQTSVDVAVEDAEFRATGSVLKFDGYLAAWRAGREPVEKAEEDAADEEFGENGGLPADLVEGEALRLRDLSGEQKFTEPPPRFSEATLVRELEERGIGRPSTYAAIVGTIQTKQYVRKDEGKLKPTELGRTVNDLLVAHFSDVVDYDFTARMEQDLDEVEEGRKGRLDVLGSFYGSFSETLEKAKTEMRSVKKQAEPAGVDCELCGKPMLIRFGKNGTFLGCSGYPACRNTREMQRDESGQVSAREAEDVGTCPKCGQTLLVRSGRFGKFIACSTYPKCDYTRPYTRTERCPNPGCDGLLAERVSRKGKTFFSCSNYPKCKFIASGEPVAETCPQCAAPTLFARSSRVGGRSLRCMREGCGYTRRERGRAADGDEGAAAGSGAAAEVGADEG
ncbi:MAG: type I DNA topoisomerase [Deltaproteobacteria bacterium]|nr:type I DNA topoisomerase [Deltaproteobacteria bacterium]